MLHLDREQVRAVRLAQDLRRPAVMQDLLECLHPACAARMPSLLLASHAWLPVKHPSSCDWKARYQGTLQMIGEPSGCSLALGHAKGGIVWHICTALRPCSWEAH